MEQNIWIFIFIYLLLQLGIGYWVSRRISSDTDYFLAGRSLGPFYASMSLFATWFGAETCMGSSAAIFEHGLSGSRADPFGYALCLVLFGLLLAKPLRDMELTTLGDFYRIRYSGAVEKLAVLIMVPTSLLWAAAQVRAFGQILAAVSPLDPVMGVTVAAAFVVAYTFLGGLMGDVITDVLQGFILLLGLLVLFVAVISHMGGPYEALMQIQMEQLSLLKEGEGFLARLDTWAVPIFGSLVAQELVSRSLATRSGEIARSSSFWAAGIYLSVGLLPVIIGLLGPHLQVNVPHTDQFLPTLAEMFLSPWAYVFFAGALVSAILSTVDSTILTISAFLTHNLGGSRYYDLSSSSQLRISRLLVVLCGGIAYVLALSADGIYDLVLEASAFGTSGLLVVTVVGVWIKKAGLKRAALFCVLAGIISTLMLRAVPITEAPFITSAGVSLVVFIITALFEQANCRWQKSG